MRVGIELVVPTRRRSAGGTWDSSGGAILGRGLLYAVRQVEGRRAVLYYSNGDELESAYGAARTPLCSVRGRELAGTGTTGRQGLHLPRWVALVAWSCKMQLGQTRKRVTQSVTKPARSE